jgi:hypothetical protein
VLSALRAQKLTLDRDNAVDVRLAPTLGNGADLQSAAAVGRRVGGEQQWVRAKER